MYRLGRLSAIAWFVSVLPALGQAPPAAPPATTGPPPAVQQTVRLYVDCSVWGCDWDYMRTEIAFVDFVRERQDADVIVLVTGQQTGSGGTEVTLKFTGRGPFQGVDDELKFASGQNDSDDTRRRDLVQMLKLGLARYAARTGIGRTLQLTERKTGAGPAAGAPRSGKDPWNYWVFRIGLGGNMSGEAASRYVSIYGSASANRTTEAWKLNFSGSADYSQNQYTFSDGSGFTSVRRDYNSGALVVKSLTGHWSVGARGSVGTSSYYNQDLAIKAAPAIEYDIFPYSESTRRQFTLRYTLGYFYADYAEMTLFGKMTDHLARHDFAASVNVKQPWGSISGEASAAQYLNDLSKWNMEVGGYASFKLLKGLSLSVSGSNYWIRDQISLPRGSATNEEVLVRQRQLATSYSYRMYVSVSYSFGSIFNNVVNPRMSGWYF